MSALPVPPSHDCRARGQGPVLRTISAETYHAFLAPPDGAAFGTAFGTGFLQCPSWADAKEGWHAQLLGWGPDPEAGELTGVVLVLLWQVPGNSKYFAYLLPEGPVTGWTAPDVDGRLGLLLEHLRRASALACAVVDSAVSTQTGEPPAAALRFAPALADGDPVMAAWLGTARTPAQCEQNFVHSLADLHSQDHSAALPAHARPELSSAVRRAMEYCEEHAAELVSVADMAAAARVSPRTLQDRFRTDLGTTPAAHLRRVRLDRAHQDLLRIADGSASGTVTDVAARWGFTHLGRFAAYYREAYGQVPSRTAERRQMF
ncbi:helix-turn-helix transcriptional regulator [Streptomyces sp. B21-101]|uniref:helix-turn-helix transcriptional regulator n=1 Tax=Streptomyces sp. B21-101 TaxID=3039415 RepID=UPI002FF01862